VEMVIKVEGRTGKNKDAWDSGNSSSCCAQRHEFTLVRLADKSQTLFHKNF